MKHLTVDRIVRHKDIRVDEFRPREEKEDEECYRISNVLYNPLSQYIVTPYKIIQLNRRFRYLKLIREHPEVLKIVKEMNEEEEESEVNNEDTIDNGDTVMKEDTIDTHGNNGDTEVKDDNNGDDTEVKEDTNDTNGDDTEVKDDTNTDTVMKEENNDNNGDDTNGSDTNGDTVMKEETTRKDSEEDPQEPSYVLTLDDEYVIQEASTPVPIPTIPHQTRVYQVKWEGSSYNEITWELDSTLVDDKKKIMNYLRFIKPPDLYANSNNTMYRMKFPLLFIVITVLLQTSTSSTTSLLLTSQGSSFENINWKASIGSFSTGINEETAS